MESIIWVGLDVHKSSITAAVLDGDSAKAEVTQLSPDLNRVRRFFRGLAKRGTVRACYEASGAGYVLQRALEHDGFWCEVIAPSLIPRKPGDRRKTDRLDAIQLARLYRSGHLTPIRIPTADQEAVRSLVRLRHAYQSLVKMTKHRINGILLSQGRTFTTRSLWTKAHRSWLEEQREDFDGPLGTVLRMELEHLEYMEAQVNAVDLEIERYARRESYRPLVEALECLRGVKTLTAMTLASEIGDIHRFRSPRALMSWVGLGWSPARSPPGIARGEDRSQDRAMATSAESSSSQLGITVTELGPISSCNDVGWESLRPWWPWP